MSQLTGIEKEFADIYQTLTIADKLSVEVIHAAMNHLKNNPHISISEALDYGLSEWIK